MTKPRVPGGDDERLKLPCGEWIHPTDIDLGVREFYCDCGGTHAVVVDAHPVSRFVPEAVVEVLREATETADEFPEFGLPHVMGMVTEEFSDAVAVADVSEDGRIGYALLWVCDFESRRLHEIVVELLVELMEHAASHGDDETAERFEGQMLRFDVEAFVEQYRREREFESEFDAPV